MSLDRFKEAFAALVRAGVPGIDYLTTYRARVVSQSSDGAKVDVQPDDARLPSMSGIRLKLGIPGAITHLDMSGDPAYVQVGWENGDPTKPFASLFDGGATVVKLSVSASSIVLDGSVFSGGEAGAEGAAKGLTLQTFLDLAIPLISTHTHAVSGAAAGPSPMLAELQSPSIVATKAKVV